MQLERDLQPASLLASIGGILVDPGVFDDEETDPEHDQVPVRAPNRRARVHLHSLTMAVG